MTLAARVIPVLLHDRHTLVKGKQFDWHRPIGHVEQAARIYGSRGVDELMVLDVTATLRGTGPDIDTITKICKPQFTPVTVGGGIRDMSDVQKLFAAGADKVCIRSAWQADRTFVRKLVERYGSQAVTIAIDYRPKLHSFQSVVTRVVQAQDDGAGEIMITDMDREGMGSGYDLQMIAAVSGRVDIPVIAHGGAGSYEHMAEALLAGANAVAAGSLVAFQDATPKAAAAYLAEKGLEVRT